MYSAAQLIVKIFYFKIWEVFEKVTAGIESVTVAKRL